MYSSRYTGGRMGSTLEMKKTEMYSSHYTGGRLALGKLNVDNLKKTKNDLFFLQIQTLFFFQIIIGENSSD